MSHLRFFSLPSAGLLLTLVAFGCAPPARGTGGTGGTSSTGNGGSSGPGVGGTGSPGTGGGSNGSGGTGFTPLGGSTGTGGGSGGTAATGGTNGGGGSGSGGSGKMACGSSTSDPLPYTSGYTANATNHSNATSVASSMSNDERAQQMSGLPQSGSANFNVFNQETNTSRGIRGFYYRDGPRGVNLNATGDNQNDYSTAFPVAIARGASFDTDLEYEVGQAIGDEMLASGNTMLLAPTVNILRHPAWGRAQETYGEDVFLLGRLGSAFVTGVQKYTGACAKHFAANNIEDGRESANATMDEETLREVYGRHYEMIVQEGGVSSIMASYNEINGTHSTQNVHLLTDLLRTDFGFQGFVLSDWWAMPNGNSVPYPGVTTLEPVAQQGVNAGLDMELPWRYNYSTLTALVTAGGLQASQLVTSTARILEQKYRFNADKQSGYGLKTPFTTYVSGSIQGNDQTDPAIGMSHIALAEQAAEESMVLLKNDGNTLPIDKTKVQKVAVIGANVTFSLQETQSQDCPGGGSCMIDFTTNVRTGDAGSSRVFSEPSKSTGPFAGIVAAGGGVTVRRYNSASAAQSDGFDIAIVVAGLTPQDEGEEYTGAGDRTTGGINSTTHMVNFGLDAKANAGVQNGLITSTVTAAVALGNKPVVVVLEGGSIIDMPWLSSVQAVVMAWYPGMAGGTALGRLLFGTVDFSGKLPLTWDTTTSDWPTFAGGNGTTQMDYQLGYRYFDHNNESPQFSFGYGMSYTTFTYQNLKVPCSTVPPDGEVDVTVDVINSGNLAGAETVFLFVEYPDTAVANRMGNYKELKGFFRTPVIPAGSGGTVKIPLRIKDLKYWDSGSNQWSIEAKTVKVIIAPSAGAAAAPCSNGSGSGCSLSDTFMVTQ